MTDADSNGDFVTAAVSSKGHHANSLELRPGDLASGHMRLPSWVRADKLFSVNSAAVQQRIGVVKPELLARVRKLLCPAVGCK